MYAVRIIRTEQSKTGKYEETRASTANDATGNYNCTGLPFTHHIGTYMDRGHGVWYVYKSEV